MRATADGNRLTTTERFLRGVIFASALLAGTFDLIASASAQSFYKGKTLTIVVGSAPGGGFDAVARRLAARIGDLIPGNPNVVVQNMPGAGSLTAVRYLDSGAPKDGTVIAAFNPGVITQSIVESQKIGVDFRSVNWIGSISPDFVVCYGFGPNGVRTWDDMMRRPEFVLGSAGRGATNYIAAATMRELFHARIKMIVGFPGAGPRRLAIERGELDGDCSDFDFIPLDWMRGGKAHVFVRFTEQRPPHAPATASYIGAFAQTDEQRSFLDLINANFEVGHPYIASRQVPAERVSVLREAFAATMQDPDFRADMERQRAPVQPLSGKEAAEIIGRISAPPPEVLAEARKIFK
jgi:tripartite-type tricarboxylate transporter receptor subunit TctC